MIMQVLLQELYRSLSMRTHTMLVTVINAIRSAVRLVHMPAGNAIVVKTSHDGHSRNSGNALFGALVQTRRMR